MMEIYVNPENEYQDSVNAFARKKPVRTTATNCTCSE